MNIDEFGNMSGYSWGTNVGWINFDPSKGGVSIDMNSGEFDGFAWGENIGWIHFNGTAQDATKYMVAVVQQNHIYLPLVVRQGP